MLIPSGRPHGTSRHLDTEHETGLRRLRQSIRLWVLFKYANNLMTDYHPKLSTS
jgi:hypothetical protein